MLKLAKRGLDSLPLSYTIAHMKTAETKVSVHTDLLPAKITV